MNDEYKPAFIYPQWQRAKIQLAQALGLDEKQTRILSDWMKAHIFEFGCEITLPKYEMEMSHDPKSFINHAIRNCVYSITEKAFDKKMFLQKNTSNDRNEIITMTLLICGSPSVVGSAERG